MRANHTPILIHTRKTRNDLPIKKENGSLTAPVFLIAAKIQGNGFGVGEAAAGVAELAGALLGAEPVLDEAGAGVLGGGFTGTFDFAGVLALLAPPTAFRTAATNGSPAAGTGTDPVRMLLNSTIRP